MNGKTLTSSLARTMHILHPRRTAELENMARPHAIITICHPSYPYNILHGAYITHMMLDPKLPFFSRVRWRDLGGWG